LALVGAFIAIDTPAAIGDEASYAIQFVSELSPSDLEGKALRRDFCQLVRNTMIKAQRQDCCPEPRG
jgi:hypothetical protein